MLNREWEAVFNKNLRTVLSQREAIKRQLKLEDDAAFYNLISELLCKKHFESLYDTSSLQDLQSQTILLSNCVPNLSPAAQSIFYFQLAQEKIKRANEWMEKFPRLAAAVPKASHLSEFQLRLDLERHKKIRNEKTKEIIKKFDEIEDKHVEKIADREVNYANLYVEEQMRLRENERRRNGSFAKDEACRDFLQGLKMQIESRPWKVMRCFGIGGVVIKGLNRNQPVPDSIANLYRYLTKTLNKSHFDWEDVFTDLKKFKETAEQKNASWNFFWKRDPSTIEFNKLLGQEISQFVDALKVGGLEPASLKFV